VKKIALGVVAALLLAAFPAALAGTAGAVTNATVRFVNANDAGGGSGKAIDIYVDGVLIRANLNPGTNVNNYFDTSALGNGTHSLMVCHSGNPQGLTSAAPGPGTCLNGDPLNSAFAAAPVPQISLIGGVNYTIALSDAVTISPTGCVVVACFVGNTGILGVFIGVNDTTPTDFGFSRITIHNTTAGTLDVCVDGDKVLTGIAGGSSQQVEVEAQQNAAVQIFSSAAGCPGPANTINLVAGTNLVILTVAVTGTPLFPPCTSDCGQVLFVDQERHPNVANTSAFCANVLNLAKFQADYKTVLGGVNPNDSLTYPSRGAVSDLTAEIDSTVTNGDLTVPGEIKPQWETISAGLRMLSQVFKLVDFDVSKFPVVASNGDHVSLEQIVEGANGFSLPGVKDPDLVAAVSALTNWYKANCAPAPTPAAPAAVPAAAGPRFTG